MMKTIGFVCAAALLPASMAGVSSTQQTNQTAMSETVISLVNVTDQAIAGDGVVGNVTVDEVVSNGSGCGSWSTIISSTIPAASSATPGSNPG